MSGLQFAILVFCLLSAGTAFGFFLAAIFTANDVAVRLSEEANDNMIDQQNRYCAHCNSVTLHNHELCMECNPVMDRKIIEPVREALQRAVSACRVCRSAVMGSQIRVVASMPQHLIDDQGDVVNPNTIVGRRIVAVNMDGPMVRFTLA